MAVFTPISGGPVGSGLLPSLPTISADMKAIYAASSLVDWWTADTGVVGTGSTFQIIGRKGHNRMVPDTGTDSPTVVASAHNGRAALQAGTTAGTIGDLGDGGANLFPVNASFSLVYVGRRGTNDSYLLNSGGASNTYMWHRVADDKVTVGVGGVSQITSTVVVAPTAPHIGIYSYDFATKVANLRLNRSLAGTKTSVANENTSSKLKVLGRGDAAAANSAGAQIFEWMIFNTAIHLNATLLANVETYLADRYALV